MKIRKIVPMNARVFLEENSTVKNFFEKVLTLFGEIIILWLPNVR